MKKTIYKVTSAGFAAFLLLGLTACGGPKSNAREILGIARNSPDEFTVVPRPPLNVPDEFYLNPPSHVGEPANGVASENAKEVVSGVVEDAMESANDTGFNDAADEAFLRKLGADKADSNIKKELSEEAWATRDEQDTLWDAVQNKTSEEPVVDAKQEADRIRANKKQGKALNDGETPEINPAEDSPLKKIFNQL